MEIEKKYIVYKHICNINNKKYVGITCQRPENRWANGKSYKKNEDFYSDILKFDWNEGFDHKILIRGLTLEQAWNWEKKLIKYWDLMNPEKGYNKDSGGNSGKIPSEETRKKQSVIRKEKIANGEITFPNTGKPLSEVAKIKMSKRRKEMFANGEMIIWNKGKTGIYTEESLKKMSESKKGKKLSEESIQKLKQTCSHKIYKTSKIILCVETNIIYKSINEAERQTGLNRQNISKCCNGKRKTTGGYHWKFIN